jgi:hypothetical protein
MFRTFFTSKFNSLVPTSNPPASATDISGDWSGSVTISNKLIGDCQYNGDMQINAPDVSGMHNARIQLRLNKNVSSIFCPSTFWLNHVRIMHEQDGSFAVTDEDLKLRIEGVVTQGSASMSGTAVTPNLPVEVKVDVHMRKVS